jgi:hypothetical protein
MQQKCPFYRFLTVSPPFLTVFHASQNSESLDESGIAPLSRVAAPIKNGENGVDGAAPGASMFSRYFNDHFR